jgi:hypothetical protein
MRPLKPLTTQGAIMFDDISGWHAGVDTERTLGSRIAVPVGPKCAEFWRHTGSLMPLSAGFSLSTVTSFRRSPLFVRTRIEVEAASRVSLVAVITLSGMRAITDYWS